MTGERADEYTTMVLSRVLVHVPVLCTVCARKAVHVQ